MAKTSPRQQRFVDEYLVDLNATQAAIRAGYSPKYAGQNADKLLKNTNIAAAIQKRRDALSGKLEITQERVLQELAAIGFANATDFVSVAMGYVKVIDTAQLPEPKRAALAGIKQSAYGIEIKTHDKVRALELLGKHFGLFDNREAPGGVENNLFDAIVGNAGEGMETDDIPEIEQAATAGDDMVESSDVQTP